MNATNSVDNACIGAEIASATYTIDEVPHLCLYVVCGVLLKLIVQDKSTPIGL